jgi:hypothetical protein
MNDIPTEFERIGDELETGSRYDLKPDTLALVDSLLGDNADPRWSFIPHPTVLEALTGKKFARFILTVDTIDANVHLPVLNFLREQRFNITVYSTNGWADFICDVRMSAADFYVWIGQLISALEEAGAATYADDRDVRTLISVFRVDREWMLCRRILGEIGKPSAEALKSLAEDPTAFEILYQDYESKPARTQVEASGSTRQAYLHRLKQEKAIICFKTPLNVGPYRARDVVALHLHDGTIGRFLDAIAQNENGLRDPVEDLLVGGMERCAEPSQSGAHVFLFNSYRYAGERDDWKLRLYTWAAGADAGGRGKQKPIPLNAYAYPLDRLVADRPVFLTGYPDYLERLSSYEGPSFAIGFAVHRLLQEDAAELGVPLAGLAKHGVTLGPSGTGKTNTGLVLARALLRQVKTVVMLDQTNGAAGKLGGLDSTIRVHSVQLTSGEDLERLLANPPEGLCILSWTEIPLSLLLKGFCGYIDRAPDATHLNAPREIRYVLAVEEAADAWQGPKAEAEELGGRLVRTLLKTERKGWAVWLSTQRPGELGPTPALTAELLDGLQNQVIHKLEKPPQIEVVIAALKADGHALVDLDYVRQAFKSMAQKGQAILRGAGATGPLPPVLIRVPEF